MVVSYVDTLELFAPSLPKGIRAQIAATGAGKVLVEPCGKANATWGVRLIVHQATRRTLPVLQEIQTRFRATVCRLDVAFDFSDWDPEWFEHHAIMRYRRAGPMHDEENGTYWVTQNIRQRRSERDVVVYGDQPGKMTGEIDIAHFEVRFQRTGAVRRMGVDQVKDILALDPRALLARNFKFVRFDPEAFKLPIIRATVRDDIARYRGKAVTPFLDRYRANIPRRARSLLEHGLQDRAQRVKDIWPSYAAKLPEIPIDELNIPTALTWRD
jgi:hypothetical protein